MKHSMIDPLRIYEHRQSSSFSKAYWLHHIAGVKRWMSSQPPLDILCFSMKAAQKKSVKHAHSIMAVKGYHACIVKKNALLIRNPSS